MPALQSSPCGSDGIYIIRCQKQKQKAWLSSVSDARYDIGWISVFIALVSPNEDEALMLHAVVVVAVGEMVGNLAFHMAACRPNTAA